MSVRRTNSFYYVTQKKHARRPWEGVIATSRQNAWLTQDLTKSLQEMQGRMWRDCLLMAGKKILGCIPIWVKL